MGGAAGISAVRAPPLLSLWRGVRMAQFPCDHCGRRYKGPGNRAYVAILEGSSRWEHKPRLCPIHLQELEELFDNVQGRLSQGDPRWANDQMCLICADIVDGQPNQPVFMTSYAARDEREDFYAPLHASCAPAAKDALTGHSGVAQTT